MEQNQQQSKRRVLKLEKQCETNCKVYWDGDGVKHSIYLPKGTSQIAHDHLINKRWDELAKFAPYTNQGYSEDDFTYVYVEREVPGPVDEEEEEDSPVAQMEQESESAVGQSNKRRKAKPMRHCAPNCKVYWDGDGVKHTIYMPRGTSEIAHDHLINKRWDELAKFEPYTNQGYSEDDFWYVYPKESEEQDLPTRSKDTAVTQVGQRAQAAVGETNV